MVSEDKTIKREYFEELNDMRIRNGRLLAERKEERKEAKKKVEEKEIKVPSDTVESLMKHFFLGIRES